MSWKGEQSTVLPTAYRCLLSSKVYGVVFCSDKLLGSVQVVGGWHSHDVQKIHTHYLAASSGLEICEFTADWELWPAVTLSMEPVPVLWRAENLLVQKPDRRVCYHWEAVGILIFSLAFLDFLDNIII